MNVDIEATKMAHELEKGVAWDSKQVEQGKEFGAALASALIVKGYKVGQQFSTLGHKASFEAVLEKNNHRVEITSAYFMRAFTEVRSRNT